MTTRGKSYNFLYRCMDINGLQRSIMVFVKWWANTKKTPVPKREIIKHMEVQKVKVRTASNAIDTLIEKGYVRRAYTEQANRTSYVMIRNI